MQIDGTGVVADQLAAFGARLRGQGAWFHPSLVIRVEGTELSMVSDAAFTDRRSLLRVPLSLMPVIEAASWSVRTEGADVLLQAAPEPAASAAHRDMLSAMLDIYNATGKLSQWREESPWSALRAHPDILRQLYRARAHTPKAQTYHHLVQQGDADDLLVKTFLGSRAFNLSPDHRRMAGHGDVDAGATVLMPVIDYFNHRFAAEGFSVHETPSPASMRVFGVPDPDSGELFVRYNAYDPMDTYLFYGFVDTGAPWLGSIPLSLTVGDKILAVEARGGTVKGALPPPLRDLRLFLPQVVRQDDLGITLNKLLIPGAAAPRALQRVLASFVSTLGVSQGRLPAEVARLEEAILEQNDAYWSELADCARGLDAAHPVHALRRHAQAHLDAYRQFRPRLI